MKLAFSEPWHRCDETRSEEELRREVCEQHILFGVHARIVARRQDCDQFLFELPEGRFASVHLTWARESDPTWPFTKIYDSVEQMHAAVQWDIDEWNDIDRT